MAESLDHCSITQQVIEAYGPDSDLQHLVDALQVAIDRIVPECRSFHPATHGERHRKISADLLRHSFKSLILQLEEANGRKKHVKHG